MKHRQALSGWISWLLLLGTCLAINWTHAPNSCTLCIFGISLGWRCTLCVTEVLECMVWDAIIFTCGLRIRLSLFDLSVAAESWSFTAFEGEDAKNGAIICKIDDYCHSWKIGAKCSAMPMNGHTPNTGHKDVELCPNLQDHLGG